MMYVRARPTSRGRRARTAHGAAQQQLPTMMSTEQQSARWVCLSAAIVATFAGTGVGYAWGLFSPALKSRLHLTQPQLLLVASAPAYVVSLPPMAFFPGWVYDRGGDRWGALYCMLFAGVGLGGGYLLMWATAERLVPIFPQVPCLPAEIDGSTRHWCHTPHWNVGLLATGNIMASFGASFSTVAGMCVIVKNFPEQRGTIVGVVKCVTGLSGGMYQRYLWMFYVLKSGCGSASITHHTCGSCELTHVQIAGTLRYTTDSWRPKMAVVETQLRAAKHTHSASC
jgi:hypothetical protein